MYPLKIEYQDIRDLKKLSLVYQELESLDYYSKLVRWISLKKKDWKHENEWRYVFLNISPTKYDEARLIEYPKEAINEIILGYKFFPNVDYKYIDDKTTKYVFNRDIEADYPYKILQYLFENNEVTLKRVVLNEDFTLTNQRIFVTDITKNQVTILRE